MLKPLAALLLTTSAALADVPEAVQDHILPGYAAFAAATATLAEAGKTCGPELQPAYQAAFDAWMGVQHLRLGPVEDEGRYLAIWFWPDPKGMGAKAQKALLTGDAAKFAPEAFAQQSVAARGLMALERLLYPAEPLASDPCPLIGATTADLARTAAEVLAGWQEGYGQTLSTGGAAGNATFLSAKEARQALFTQLATALETLSDQRLGRPLGEFDTPHPERAEARASGRSLRNVTLALQSLRAMTVEMTPDAPLTLAAFDHALELAERLDDPVLAGVADPSGRLKVEILDQAVDHILELVVSEVGPEMDVGIGFNAADGD